jgi:hypothetical protein
MSMGVCVARPVTDPRLTANGMGGAFRRGSAPAALERARLPGVYSLRAVAGICVTAPHAIAATTRKGHCAAESAARVNYAKHVAQCVRLGSGDLRHLDADSTVLVRMPWTPLARSAKIERWRTPPSLA